MINPLTSGRMAKFCALILSLCSLINCSNVSSEEGSTSLLEREVAAIVQPFIDSAQIAGIGVAVVHDGQVLLEKGFGYADLEFDVPMPDDASFEIGSITKQFTAVAILQLLEQGKLSLEEDFRSYLPDFDTKGRIIPLYRLLNHTSGIKSYTDLPEFWPLSVYDLPRDTLLRIVEQAGFDFEPGEALIYNNTAYFILGLIIEQVSGLSYEEYIQKKLFDPLGMDNSYYCNEQSIVKKRAHGYEMDGMGLVRKSYLDHKWPYAAGSLCSTVGDLVKWNEALHKGGFISEDLYRQLITPDSLTDGTPIRYAFGLLNTTNQGWKVISHGGGINGFLSDARYFPNHDLLVVALINTAGPVSPANISRSVAALILGEKEVYEEKFSGELKSFAGTYEGRGRGRDLSVSIKPTGKDLLLKESQDDIDTLRYGGDGIWQYNDQLFRFSNSEEGVGTLHWDIGSGVFVLERANQ